MKLIKKIWGGLGRRIYIIISAVVLLIVYVASIVVTQNAFLYNTVTTLFAPGERVLVSGDPSQHIRYVNDEGITDKQSALAAGNALNEEIASEGFTLLKNENGVLPLASGARVSVFGQNSNNLVYGGTGSGGMDSSNATTIAQSLANAGFRVNDTLVNLYNNSGYRRGSSPDIGTNYLPGFATGEAPVNIYTDAVQRTFSEYNDAAVVVFSRVCGEGFDLPRTMKDSNGNPVNGARSADDHYLQLDQNETNLLDLVCRNFDNVVVVINSSSTMELGFLDDPTHYAYHEQIKGALWIGSPGGSGINALGKILAGAISPSGRTVDTYARNFKNDPTWQNIGDNLARNGNTYIVNGRAQTNTAHFVEYEEGIYVGYRYYETRGFEEAQAGNAGWYDANVVYPFGYGESYADFEWQLKEVRVNGEAVNAADTIALSEDTVISLDVEVSNVSELFDKAAKDVVELYFTAPYDEVNAPVEKSHVVLADFAKTDALSQNESGVVTLEVSAYEMASYDYNDKNKNDNSGYELEAGDYVLKIAKNAHDQSPITVTANVAQTINVKNDASAPETAEIVNRFDDVSAHFDEANVKLMSRADFVGTFPTMPTEETRATTQEFIDSLRYSVNDKTTDPWYVDEADAPEQRSSALSYNATRVKLYELIGKDYDDPMWDELLDQLTPAQMAEVIGTGNFNSAAITNIDKPRTIEPDGPGGFTNFMAVGSAAPVYDTVFYASECVIGATWNVDLTYRMGVMVGNESLIGNARGDGTTYSGWYAPAVNIHRSQFSGRNFEYYSEDGVLSGKMAVGVIQGASEKGVYTYVKHFALNDQETHRDSNGLITWATEQAMREIYFKPFEYAVKEGHTRGMMSSFNRLGTTWAGGSYALLTEVLRNEWGFVGSVVTDYNLTSYMNVEQMIRAGGDLVLSQDKKPNYSRYNTPTEIAQMRRAVKNILFVTANSNALNGFGEGVIYKYTLPGWHVALIGGVLGLTAAVLLSYGGIAFYVYKSSKKSSEKGD